MQHAAYKTRRFTPNLGDKTPHQGDEPRRPQELSGKRRTRDREAEEESIHMEKS
jgi:hypothetical protein